MQGDEDAQNSSRFPREKTTAEMVSRKGRIRMCLDVGNTLHERCLYHVGIEPSSAAAASERPFIMFTRILCFASAALTPALSSACVILSVSGERHRTHAY